MNKPNGQFVIQPHEVEQFVKTLPLKKIPGVGKVTSERLLKMGLETCEDVQQLDQSILLNIFGKMGKRIWDFSHGIDDREIQALSRTKIYRCGTHFIRKYSSSRTRYSIVR